jgi:hypothetical protein
MSKNTRFVVLHDQAIKTNALCGCAGLTIKRRLKSAVRWHAERGRFAAEEAAERRTEAMQSRPQP